MEGKGEYALAFSRIHGEKLGWMIIINYYTRVKVEKIMTCAYVCVYMSRDMNSGRVQIRVSPLLRGWALQQQH